MFTMFSTTAARQALAALAVASLVRATPASPFAGPYLSFADSFSPCTELRGHLLLNVTVTPFNKKEPLVLQKLTGNVAYDHGDGIDDTYWVRVRMDQRSNHEWKLNAFIFNFPTLGCSTIRKQLPGFADVVFGPNPPDVNGCLVKSGNYIVDNQPINWTFPFFPAMPYGHWRFHLRMGKGRKTLGCSNVVCHTIPRPLAQH